MSTQRDSDKLSFFYITDSDENSINKNATETTEETTPKVFETTDKGQTQMPQQCVLGFEIPKLQNPHESHLFVASSSEDREKVETIVEDLESQFGIKCLFASRDFQPGKEYRLMIKEGLDTSLKVLLIFTPNFVKSPFCQLEAELAYIQSVERKNDCAIPVLLENCEVPATLKPRNYIDATQPGVDLSIKIIEALVRIESPTNVIPFKFCKDDEGAAKGENGSYVDINAVRGESWGESCMRAAKLSSFKFYLRRSDVQKLKDNDIIASTELLKHTMKMLNGHPAIKRHHMLDGQWPWFLGFGTIPFTLFLCLAMFIGKILSFGTAHPSNKMASFVETGLWVAIVPLAFGALSSISIYGYRYCMKRKQKKDSSELRSKLWNDISYETYKDGLLFLLFNVLTPGGIPQLRVMKYDSCGCKRYIMMLLRRKDPVGKTDQEIETIADSIIRDYLKRMCTTDIIHNLDIFPKAEYKRHGVTGSRMCICQRFESLQQSENQ